MKKNYRIFIVLPLLFLGALSCSDDDTGETLPENRISYYGIIYPIGIGAVYHDNNYTVISEEEYVFEDRYVWKDEQMTDKIKGFTADIADKQSGNFLLCFYEEGFVISSTTKDARGAGACVCLRMASPDTQTLMPGEYTYSTTRDEFTFQGYASANYNTNGDVDPVRIIEGKVSVAQENEVYTISFSCKTDFTGSVIEGVYTGPLKAINIQKSVDLVYSYDDIRLEALFDQVVYFEDGNILVEPDYIRGTAFLNSVSKQVYSAASYSKLSKSQQSGIDIALAYERETETLYFESPIRMRALLWHNRYETEDWHGYSFDLPCHTRYMPAPATFTEADFEGLNRLEDFAFNFVEAKTSIPVHGPLPRFVFVQTGNGMCGVIRVREITPETTETSSGIIYPVNPRITMDIKYPRNFSEQKLR